MNKHELKNQGGPWLGAARKWIQRHCINGSSVIWGSSNILQHQFTVKDVEDLASEVAEAALQSRNSRYPKGRTSGYKESRRAV